MLTLWTCFGRSLSQRGPFLRLLFLCLLVLVLLTCLASLSSRLVEARARGSARHHHHHHHHHRQHHQQQQQQQHYKHHKHHKHHHHQQRPHGSGSDLQVARTLAVQRPLPVYRSLPVRTNRHWQQTSQNATSQPSSTTGESKKFKRQAAVELAISNLHILESLDGQLRNFSQLELVKADELELKANSREDARQIVCYLRLVDSFEPRDNIPWGQKRPNCLENVQLAANVPPYMLNLYSQLSGESSSLAEAVRQMPYQALVMRSFRQPVDYQPWGADQRQGDNSIGDKNHYQQQHNNNNNNNNNNNHHHHHHHSNLYAKAPETADNETDELIRRAGRNHIGVHNHHQVDLVVELSALDGSSERMREEEGTTGRRRATMRQQWLAANEACNLNQRRLPAFERQELCYWFPLGRDVSAKINGSLARSRDEGHKLEPDDTLVTRKAELLVEAELHVFKLLPQLPRPNHYSRHSNGNQEHDLRRHRQQDTIQRPPAGSQAEVESPDVEMELPSLMVSREEEEEGVGQFRNGPGAQKPQQNGSGQFGSPYKLKTNLLEVSLYQILPKKSQLESAERRLLPVANKTNHNGSAENNDDTQSKGFESSSLDKEFPLRLLDIRRIDLDTSGWETFYVKRAVEDWISDESSNLGLVIKAKSMFEEPIRIGLIRFADLYDHKQPPGPQLRQNANIDSDSGRGRATDNFLPGTDQSGARRVAGNEARGGAGGPGQVGAERERARIDKQNEAFEFDLNHQPILVIYTTTTTTTTTEANSK